MLFTMEKPNPALGLLLLFLLCIIFLGVGYFSTKLPALRSGVAFFIGTLLDTTLNYAPAIHPDSGFFPFPDLLKIMRAQLVYLIFACVLGYLGGLSRKRLKRRWARNRDEMQ
jgi:hypothetical protein